MWDVGQKLDLVNCPKKVRILIESFRDTCMNPVFVGGCVRDALLGREISEYDIEVYGCDTQEMLARHLEQHCLNVCYVGQSFGVFKVGKECEFSLPREDSKSGTKHTEFDIEFLPKDVSFAYAGRRRDLTINCMGYDPFKCVLHDPYNGRQDLRDKRLRCVDPETFGEDPLRPWRVVQFAARLDMVPDAELCALSRVTTLDIAPERICAELAKWFQEGNDLQRGWRFFIDAELGRYIPSAWVCWQEKYVQEKTDQAFGRLQAFCLKKDAMMTLGVLVLSLFLSHKEEFLNCLKLSCGLRKSLKALRNVQEVWSLHKGWCHAVAEALISADRLGLSFDIIAAFGRVCALDNWSQLVCLWNEKREQSFPIIQGRDVCALGVPSGPMVGRLVHWCHKLQVEKGIQDKSVLIKNIKRMLGGVCV